MQGGSIFVSLVGTPYLQDKHLQRIWNTVLIQYI